MNTARQKTLLERIDPWLQVVRSVVTTLRTDGEPAEVWNELERSRKKVYDCVTVGDKKGAEAWLKALAAAIGPVEALERDGLVDELDNAVTEIGKEIKA